MKVLNVEDNIMKHMDIVRALAWNGITDVTHKKNMEDGLAELAAQHYDLLVLDMQFPLEKGAEVDTEAGMKLLARLQEQKNEIPVIICSSDRLRIDGVIGCIFYNPSRDLNFDFKDLLAQI